MSAQRLICSWIGAFGLATGAFGQTYVQFSIPPFDTYPTSINAAGTVAGYFGYSFGQKHGFVRNAAGTITKFDVPGSSQTWAYSINAAGVITGYYVNDGTLVHGFVRDPAGNFSFFDVPTGNYTYPVSINAGGAVTGYSGNDGFLRDADGTITSFDPGFNTRAQSINSRGVILGNYTNSTGNSVSSFVRSADGTITLLLDQPNFCPHGLGLARSINEGGVITGDCYVNQIVQSAGWVRYP